MVLLLQERMLHRSCYDVTRMAIANTVFTDLKLLCASDLSRAAQLGILHA
jgi:hypothetical protein